MGLIKKLLDDVFRDLTSLGGGVFYGLILFSCLVSFNISLFIDILIGGVFSFLVVILIRTFYFKNRPNKEKHKGYISKIVASSFPSLHSARAVFLGLVFYSYLSSYLLSLFVIVMSLAVVYSRVYLKKHDFVDVIGGIVLGLVTYWIILLI
jgi:membrane-associated phospholipid phosphatase